MRTYWKVLDVAPLVFLVATLQNVLVIYIYMLIWHETGILFHRSCVASLPSNIYLSLHYIYRRLSLNSRRIKKKKWKTLMIKIQSIILSLFDICYRCLVLELRTVTPCKNLLYPRKLSFPSEFLMQSLSKEYAAGAKFNSCRISIWNLSELQKLESEYSCWCAANHRCTYQRQFFDGNDLVSFLFKVVKGCNCNLVPSLKCLKLIYTSSSSTELFVCQFLIWERFHLILKN